VLVIREVRVFDGEHVLERATVVVRDGMITEVRLKPDTTVIDGAGMTLLPGLIDSHMHVAGENPLAQTLASGVTTALDMFAMPEWIRAMKQEDAPDRAELRSSGICATAPGGHGTQFKIEIPTVATPEQAQPFVDARLAEGADYIKIIYGPSIRLATEVMSRETMAALVRAAHARGTLAVVHVHQQHRAAEAIEAGADGLVHVFSDAPPAPGLLTLAAERKPFGVPTLAVLEGLPAVASGKTPPFAYANAVAAVRALHRAGVPMLAGTDAPNPGTTHGASLHRELELLVAAGLSRVEASRRCGRPRHFRRGISASPTAAASRRGCVQTCCWCAEIRRRTSRRRGRSSRCGSVA
jgi:imidazolonepropionase-like amidohydrolase